jgi:hypothetical protein
MLSGVPAEEGFGIKSDVPAPEGDHSIGSCPDCETRAALANATAPAPAIPTRITSLKSEEDVLEPVLVPVLPSDVLTRIVDLPPETVSLVSLNLFMSKDEDECTSASAHEILRKAATATATATTMVPSRTRTRARS